MIQLKIEQNDQNKRLDHYVRKYLNNAPLSLIYKLFRKKDIKVNQKPAKPEYLTQLGDTITIYVRDEDLHQKRELSISKKQDFSIVYEDENVLIVNKPIHLLVHDGENPNEDTLTKQVLNYLIESNQYQSEKENSFVPALAHRIDRNTSGLVVFGKTNIALQRLFEAFSNHEAIEKKYLALVAGKVIKEGFIDMPLKKDENKKLVLVDKNGLSAKTLYQPLQCFQNSSLLEVTILTGRTHQIRVHMQHIQHPLIGDQKYGNASTDALAKQYHMKNYFLHAKQLTFKNLKKELEYLNYKTFIAPLYPWQKQLLERLSKGEK